VISGPGSRTILDTSEQVLLLDMVRCPPGDTIVIRPRSELGEMLASRGVVSVAMLARMARNFDAGICAAVELILHDRRRTLLARVLTALDDTDPVDARAFLRAALEIGGDLVPGNPGVAVLASEERMARGFLDRADRAPSFYAWSDDLRLAWRRCAFMQRLLFDPAVVTALRSALCRDASLLVEYAEQIGVLQGLTAEITSPTVLDRVASGPAHLLPPAPSPLGHLARVVGRSRRDAPIGCDDLLALISSDPGVLLRPPDAAARGWHDMRIWALEPLLRYDTSAPVRVVFSDEYVADMRSTAKAILVGDGSAPAGFVRSSPRCSPRLYQDQRPAAEPGSLQIDPEMTLEPLPAYYERMSVAYGWVLNVLADRLTPRELGSFYRARRPGAPEVDTSLIDDVVRMRDLFRGLSEISLAELGMPTVRSDAGLLAKEWMRDRGSDVDYALDDRSMIPLGPPDGAGLTKVACVVGLCYKPVTVSFVSPPRPVDSKRIVDPGEKRICYTCPVSIVCETVAVMPDDEFRAFCDGHTRLAPLIAAMRVTTPR
jgi:hypothetical protein